MGQLPATATTVVAASSAKMQMRPTTDSEEQEAHTKVPELKAVALDPGGTTGYATGIIYDGLMRVISGQDQLTHKQLWLSLKLSAPDMIICESFEFRRNARDNLVLISLELIGVVKLYCEHYNKRLFMQTAGQGKGHFNDYKLKGARLYKSSRPHANDAVRHLLTWWQFGHGFQYNTRGFENGA